jgi:hypothetical protein
MDQVMHYISIIIRELWVTLEKTPASQFIQVSDPYVFKAHVPLRCNKALCHPNVNNLMPFEAIIFWKHAAKCKASPQFRWEIQVAQAKDR